MLPTGALTFYCLAVEADHDEYQRADRDSGQVLGQCSHPDPSPPGAPHQPGRGGRLARGDGRALGRRTFRCHQACRVTRDLGGGCAVTRGAPHVCINSDPMCENVDCMYLCLRVCVACIIVSASLLRVPLAPSDHAHSFQGWVVCTTATAPCGWVEWS